MHNCIICETSASQESLGIRIYCGRVEGRQSLPEKTHREFNQLKRKPVVNYSKDHLSHGLMPYRQKSEGVETNYKGRGVRKGHNISTFTFWIRTYYRWKGPCLFINQSKALTVQMRSLRPREVVRVHGASYLAGEPGPELESSSAGWLSTASPSPASLYVAKILITHKSSGKNNQMSLGI